MKLESEFMYRGVQVKIRKSFGYQYRFIYSDQGYSCFYDNLENSKEGAKKHIDKLIDKTLDK